MPGLTERSNNAARRVKGPMAMHKRGAKGTSVQNLDRAAAAQRMPRGSCAHFLATFADERGATHHRWVPCTTRFPSLFTRSCEALEHKLGWRLVEQGAAEGQAAASEGDEFEPAILYLLSLPCSLPEKAVASMLGVGVKRLHKLLKKYYAIDQKDANELWPAVLEALPAGQLQRRDADAAHSLASGSAADTLNHSDDESELHSGGGGRSTATQMRRSSGALGTRSALVHKSAASASKRSVSSAATSIQRQPAAGPSRINLGTLRVARQGCVKYLLRILCATPAKRATVGGDEVTVAGQQPMAPAGGIAVTAAGAGKHAIATSPAIDLPPDQHRRYMAEWKLLSEQATAREKDKQLEANTPPRVAAALLCAHWGELQAAALALALQEEGKGCGGLGGGPLPCGVEGGHPPLPITSTHDAGRMALETGLRNSLLERQARLALMSAPPGVDAAVYAQEWLHAVKPAVRMEAEWLAEAIAERESAAAWALDPALQPAPPPALALRPAAAPEEIVPPLSLPKAMVPVGAAGDPYPPLVAELSAATRPPNVPAPAGGLEPGMALAHANTMDSAQSCNLLCDWEQGLPLAIRGSQSQIVFIDCDE